MSSACRRGAGLGAALLLAATLLLAACQREERDFKTDRAESSERDQVVLSGLSPGGTPPNARNTGRGEKYEADAYDMAQGKRLFAWFNCNGCHGMGGGGSGPALMDDTWIYGGNIENIVAMIEEGRPNGMPSFRGKIPENEVWQIAAFVRSMGRYVSKNAAPQRNDEMSGRPAENRLPAATPKAGGSVPSSALGTQP